MKVKEIYIGICIRKIGYFAAFVCKFWLCVPLIQSYKTDKNATPTRRNMLSVVASNFDPLGFLSPFTLTGKRILQEMCHGSIGWNDSLIADRQPVWKAH